jgi:hypothetical protein
MGYPALTCEDLQRFIDECGVIVDNSANFTLFNHDYLLRDIQPMSEQFSTSSVPGHITGRGTVHASALTIDGGFVQVPIHHPDGTVASAAYQPSSSFSIMYAKELVLLDGVESDLMRISTGPDGSRTISNHLSFFGESVCLLEWNHLTYMFLSPLHARAPLVASAPNVVVSDPTSAVFSAVCCVQTTTT